MRSFYKVLIQPPPNSAVTNLPDSLVRVSSVDEAKYLRKKRWFQLKKPSALSRHRGTPPIPKTEYDFSKVVISVNVKKDDNKADICRLVIPDPFMIYGDLFETGLLVTVEGGWNVTGESGVIFEGIIHNIKAHFKAGRESIVELICMSDMIVMGKVEQSSPMDTDDADEADPELGSYEKTIIDIAERNGFKSSPASIKLIPPLPTNSVGSPTQSPNMTDLKRLGKLASKAYAAFWIENEVLWFASLTHILDTLKPEYEFVFQEIGRPTVDIVDVRDRAFRSTSKLQLLVDDIEVVKGRPRRVLKTSSDLAAKTPKTVGFISADDVVRKNPPDDLVGYDVDTEKIKKLSKENPEEFNALFDYVNPLKNTGTIEWEKIQEYFIEIKKDVHQTESETIDPGKKLLKPDIRILSEGLFLNCPFGSWKIRPTTTAKVLGLGSRYDGVYLITDVSHSFSRDSYKSKVTMIRVGKK